MKDSIIQVMKSQKEVSFQQKQININFTTIN